MKQISIVTVISWMTAKVNIYFLGINGPTSSAISDLLVQYDKALLYHKTYKETSFKTTFYDRFNKWWNMPFDQSANTSHQVNKDGNLKRCILSQLHVIHFWSILTNTNCATCNILIIGCWLLVFLHCLSSVKHKTWEITR